MKFFTPDLLERLNGIEPVGVATALDEWEATLRHYREHVKKLKPREASKVARLLEEHCFHDAQVLNLSYQDRDKLSLVLRQGDQLHVLTLVLVAEPSLLQPERSPAFTSAGLLWLYEEVDSELGDVLLRVLLSDGSELTIPLASATVESFDVHKRRAPSKGTGSSKQSGKRAKGVLAAKEHSALDHLMPVIPPLDRRTGEVRFPLVVRTRGDVKASHGKRSPAAKAR